MLNIAGMLRADGVTCFSVWWFQLTVRSQEAHTTLVMPMRTDPPLVGSVAVSVVEFGELEFFVDW